MKTIVLDKVISEKELFYIYNQVISSPTWNITGESGPHNGFMSSPILIAKDNNGGTQHYPFCLWGQTLVYRIAKILENKNVGIPTDLIRMWFNITYHGRKTQHWLHRDNQENSKFKSILLFITPVWQPDWRGSFYVDGEEFKYKPGSAVVFDSNEYHKGESPTSETYNWHRITLNMIVGK